MYECNLKRDTTPALNGQDTMNMITNTFANPDFLHA